MIRVINPASEILFNCRSQSFMRTPGEMVSLVKANTTEVRMICYNQAEDTITTIHNYGNYNSDSEPDSDY